MPCQLLDIIPRSARFGILALLLAGATAAHADAAAAPDGPVVTAATTSAAALEDSLPAVLRAMQKQDYALALKLLTAAGAQHTTAPDLQLLLGICYARVGQLVQAEPLLLQAAAHGDEE
jgi:Flp pilus assembly protein TadD